MAFRYTQIWWSRIFSLNNLLFKVKILSIIIIFSVFAFQCLEKNTIMRTLYVRMFICGFSTFEWIDTCINLSFQAINKERVLKWSSPKSSSRVPEARGIPFFWYFSLKIHMKYAISPFSLLSKISQIKFPILIHSQS